jgi:hypothetical protein
MNKEINKQIGTNTGNTFHITEPEVAEEDVKVLYEVPGTGDQVSELGSLKKDQVLSGDAIITPDLKELKIQTNQEHFSQEGEW